MRTELTKVAFTVAALLTSSFVAAADEDQDKNSAKQSMIERMQIIGRSGELRREAGSATLIGEVELEKFSFDDINRVLYAVPGVNIREEDGYGLRPNIGFRGVTPERSKKITVMEDGVLIGPAPYSAPAAYYFPMMAKMTSVEVFKGPSAIKYGPNTVAGALNLTSRAIPEDSEGRIDIGFGSDGFQKVLGHYGNTNGNFGYIIDGAIVEADGFKELDNGGDTGFSKKDIMAKFAYDFSKGSTQNLIELKLGYATEKSDETYLGLTDADFALNPNRRYVASALDLMDTEHQQIQLTHFFSNEHIDVTTRLYRNDFERSWNKINGFNGGQVTRTLQEVLANPEDDFNQPFYQVLTGEIDSNAVTGNIILGDNYREYYSQGIQSELNMPWSFSGVENTFNAGVRFHQDQIKRRHTENAYFMRSGALVDDGNAIYATTTNLEETDAISVFLQNTSEIDALELTFGVRGEFLDAYYQNQAPGKENDWQKKETRIWLPSVSGFYSLSQTTGLLFGIHEGFIPTSPQEAPEIEIESSVNYEIGARYQENGHQLEIVGFFNDIKNLKESCTFSTADACSNSLDEEFNGGEVDVYGLEFTASTTFSLNNGFEVPLSLVYTLTDSEFKQSFTSDFPMWGIVEKGDSLPYLADHQVSFSFGLVADRWDINGILRYIDEMQEVSGDGEILSGVMTKAQTVLDLSAHYDLDDYGKVYVKLDNVLDDQEVVSRRPYGARPSKPQQFQVGYQYQF